MKILKAAVMCDVKHVTADSVNLSIPEGVNNQAHVTHRVCR